MDTRWLQDFLTLAELGSFTRAAEARNLSQAAFSRRIQSLEAWLGTVLVDRSVFPTRLTPQGERFRERAGEVLRHLVDARGELSARPARGHVRIAIPYVLATTRFPCWWEAWSRDSDLSCSLELGNVHDTITLLAAGSVDILVCFHNAQQPIQLDPDHYERVVVRTEALRPYASRCLLAKDAFTWPGTTERPVPLLMYSPTVYFARLVDLAIKAAPVPLAARRVAECDMSDVLRGLALASFGVAWLPECSVDPRQHESLVPVDDGSWSPRVSTVAFRNRANRHPALDQLWERLAPPPAEDSNRPLPGTGPATRECPPSPGS